MVIATKRATSLKPIIFAAAADPLGTGLVASLARPGGNVTGLSIQHTDLASKHLELLREMVPGFDRLAIMVNVENPASMLEMRQVDAAARPLNLEVVAFGIRQVGPALKDMKEKADDALYVCIDTLLFSNRTRITTFALTARLPTIFSVREYAEAGGLISYSANFPDLFRRGTMSIRFYAGQSRVTSPSSSRRSSIWSLTARPPWRWASTCRSHCSPPPTRSSNIILGRGFRRDRAVQQSWHP
jgi:ABC-type uncharacterized transport system substrate-binding protein